MAFELTSTAENSTTDWQSAYSYIEDIGDQRGYTAGLVGFCSGTGDMLQLVQLYETMRPGNPLSAYISGLQYCADIGYGSGASNAASSRLGTAFINAWKSEAANQPLFRKAQRDMRKSMYWDDALSNAIQDGVGPLGLAIHYDILVNHGPGDDSESYGGIVAAARASTSKPPSQGGNEAAYLNKLTDLREAVLEGWGDAQPDGRAPMHRALIATGNLALNTPFSWSVYSDNYTMSARPAIPNDSKIGTYVLRYTATGAGSDDVTVTVS
jgi:chitosanase